MPAPRNDIRARALSLIDAMDLNNVTLTNPDKFSDVFNQLREEYPAPKAGTIRAAVAYAMRARRKKIIQQGR